MRRSRVRGPPPAARPRSAPAPRRGERRIDGALGDLVERHAPHLVVGQTGVLGDVPGDRLALAVQVGCQPYLAGAAGLADELVELAATVLERLVARREVM